MSEITTGQGGPLAYEESGSGPVLLFIHGCISNGLTHEHDALAAETCENYFFSHVMSLKTFKGYLRIGEVK